MGPAEFRNFFRIVSICCLWVCVGALPPKARLLVEYPLSDTDNSSALEVLNDVQNTETVLTEQMMGGNIYLECVASYPIEWTYTGDGFPDFSTSLETRRAWKAFEDASTYTFSVRVNLLAVKEINTGLYTCRKVGSPQVQAFFYIYIPGKNVFLSDSSKKAIASGKDEAVLLPCTVTNPTVKVLLFRVENSGLEPLNGASFDPSTGFRLNISATPYPVFGQYICMAVKEKKVLKISLEPPKHEIVRVTPSERRVLKEGVNQIFKCEGIDNVTIATESEVAYSNIVYEEIMSPNSTFRFSATLNISRDLSDDFTIVNCQTIDGGNVLHSWEYTKYDDDMTFSYNSNLWVFSCCASSSHQQRPEISFIPCSSRSECQMKKHYCIRNSGKCNELQQYNLDGIPERCVSYPEPVNYTGDGMFLCSIRDKMKEFYFARETSGVGHPITSFDNALNDKNLIEIRTNHTGDIILGTEVQISCHPSQFFYSKEPVWAFEFEDGAVEIVDKSLLRDDFFFEKRVTIPRRRQTVKFPRKDIRKLVCYAPVQNSATDWRNASIAVMVLDPNEVKDGEATTMSNFRIES